MSAGQKNRCHVPFLTPRLPGKCAEARCWCTGGYDDHCPIATSNQAASSADIGDMALAQEQLTCRRRPVKESILNVSWKQVLRTTSKALAWILPSVNAAPFSSVIMVKMLWESEEGAWPLFLPGESWRPNAMA